MKKLKKLFIIPAIAATVSAFAVGCSPTAAAVPENVEFKYTEYSVSNGDKVTAETSGASYKLLGDVPAGVSVGSDGTFVIGEGATDGTQVVLAAVKDGKVVSTVVCKLSVPVTPPQIVFGGLSDYVLNGDRIKATSGYGITFSLKTPVDGIKINPSSGRVSFTGIVEDGTPFTVVASSRGSTAEKQYLAAVGELVTLENGSELAEYGVGRDVSFVVDYGDMQGSGAIFAEQGIIGVSVAGKTLTLGDEYTYDKPTRTVTVKQSVVQNLAMGENEIQIYTAKNAATGLINAARYIRTAADLAAINDSREALGGYYALVNDIDLSDYLYDATADESDNEGKNPGGWQPIGQYSDVTDGTATAMAFRGTFDGLGHKISGLWIDWTADRDLMWETDERGEYVLDGNGEKIPLWQQYANDESVIVWQKDENGEYLTDDYGNKIPEWEKDENGDYVLDENDEKIAVWETHHAGDYMLDENGNRVQQRSPKAQYFNAGLFGYVTSDGVIRNLEVESAVGKKNYMCSYSGGIAGVNCGLIENCLVDVTVALEPDHRVSGAFAGRNEGTIRNCISLGTILAGSRYGALCGTNQGQIINCYALDALDFQSLDVMDQINYAGRPNIISLCGEVSGLGTATANCAVYKTLEELIAGSDFSAFDGWIVTAGELPRIIKSTVA